MKSGVGADKEMKVTIAWQRQRDRRVQDTLCHVRAQKAKLRP